MTSIQQLGQLKNLITLINSTAGLPAEVQLYERLFVQTHPEAGGNDFIENLNPNSLKVLNAFVEPSLAAAKADDNFSLNGTGTLSPTGWTMRRGSWCSTWLWG